jgi:hypothetical protein
MDQAAVEWGDPLYHPVMAVGWQSCEEAPAGTFAASIRDLGACIHIGSLTLWWDRAGALVELVAASLEHKLMATVKRGLIRPVGMQRPLANAVEVDFLRSWECGLLCF